MVGALHFIDRFRVLPCPHTVEQDAAKVATTRILMATPLFRHFKVRLGFF